MLSSVQQIDKWPLFANLWAQCSIQCSQDDQHRKGIHKKYIFCNLRQNSNMLGHLDKGKADIGGSHFEKWLPFFFNRHCHVKTEITGFLIHDNTS